MSKLSRRQFIKLANAGMFSAGMALSPFVKSQGKNNKVGVALVGLGYYSSGLLAPALQMTQHCELRGIVTGSPEKIPKWQSKYGIKDSNVYSYENMHEIANNPDIDVVYVVVPTALHLKFCEIAANAGKHVWCEKPMAMTVAQCQKIIDVCKRNKVQLTVSYRMQHEPNTRALMAYQNTMPFGQYKSVVSRAGYGGNGMAADNWRMKKDMGGGAMYDMGVYPLNGTRFLTGMEPIAITARHEKSHPDIFKEVDETTFFSLEFANGLVADCGTSVVKSFNHIRLECEKGWYELRPMSEYSGVTAKTSSGLTLPAISGMQQTIQMDNDALAVKGVGPILVPGEEGMRDIHVVENAFKSAQSGKRILL
jgi:glucose-fructose oxidoreductase